MHNNLILSIVFVGLFCSSCSSGLNILKSSNEHTENIDDGLPEDAQSCLNLAFDYREGKKQDDQKSRALFKKACKL